MSEVKQFIFFDFEMLCSDRGMPFEQMEGIRLGAVKYDLQTEKISFFDRYIKPKSNLPLSTFCKKLTGISDTELNEAEAFPHVYTHFLEWIGDLNNTRFFSWSKSDLSRLEFDVKLHQLSEDILHHIRKRYIDFQAIFTRRVTKNNFSVENALQIFGLSFIGDKHHPMYDAYNTLRIYLNFLNKPRTSDLMMVKQFIGEELLFVNENNEFNKKIYEKIQQDLEQYIRNGQKIYKLKDVQKVLKTTRKIVQTYENILINRSGMFSKQNVDIIRLFVSYYHELLRSYQQHVTHSSNIMILDESPFYHSIKQKKQG